MDFSVKKLNALKWLYVNFRLNRLPDLHMVDRNLDTIKLFMEEQDEQGLDTSSRRKKKSTCQAFPLILAKGIPGHCHRCSA